MPNSIKISYMKLRPINFVFVMIGLVIGIILSLQIQSHPVMFGSYPLDQLEVRKSLFQSFSLQQEELNTHLAALRLKKEEVQSMLERRSSKETRLFLEKLKRQTGMMAATGEGIRITLSDNPAVVRNDFSSANENFVQATDLRDLINVLFLKDAAAVAVNGKRITPLTPIQPAFDSVLVANFQVNAPFIVEAIGNSESLKEAPHNLKTRKIHIFYDAPVPLKMEALEGGRPLKHLNLLPQETP